MRYLRRSVRAPCQKAPSAKKCIKTDYGTPRGQRPQIGKHRAPKSALRLGEHAMNAHKTYHVRKHRAPNGALRPTDPPRNTTQRIAVRKHLAPKGTLRQHAHVLLRRHDTRQKAPSSKRCIKTRGRLVSLLTGSLRVRKRRAPTDAVRTGICPGAHPLRCVRKHRAPKRSLRLARYRTVRTEHHVSQKAPSTKWCIKTKSDESGAI